MSVVSLDDSDSLSTLCPCLLSVVISDLLKVGQTLYITGHKMSNLLHIVVTIFLFCDSVIAMI